MADNHQGDDASRGPRRDRHPVSRRQTAARRAGVPLVGLSTTSVYPETTSSAFELAGRLGYDGVELMVGTDPVSADVDAVERLRDHHRLPVLSVHAPCLLVTQRVWGTDNWAKLERSAAAARQLGADVVVVHPPFRWQRDYATDFVARLTALRERTGVRFCLENMYPWRMGRSGIVGYLPQWDPTTLDYDDLTLDLSHASVSGQQASVLAREWGSRLGHVHLTDGTGSAKDEHLIPGRGDQHADQVLHELATRHFPGHVVCEVSTRKATSRTQRETDLAATLEFARTHLEAGRPAEYVVDSTGSVDLV